MGILILDSKSCTAKKLGNGKILQVQKLPLDVFGISNRGKTQSEVSVFENQISQKLFYALEVSPYGGEDTCGVATKSWFLGGILKNWKKPRFLWRPLE